MALEITGRLVTIMPQQTGAGKNGNWVKQEFVIETMEQYPKKVCCSAWGDKADSLRNYQPGDTIRVSFNLESREYNGRWYTDVRAWRIDVPQKEDQSGGYSGSGKGAAHKAQDDADPFAGMGGEDDLPF